MSEEESRRSLSSQQERVTSGWLGCADKGYCGTHRGGEIWVGCEAWLRRGSLNRSESTTNVCPCVREGRLFWICSGLRKTAQAGTEWLYWERKEKGWQRLGQIAEVLACQMEKSGLVLRAILYFGWRVIADRTISVSFMHVYMYVVAVPDIKYRRPS